MILNKHNASLMTPAQLKILRLRKALMIHSRLYYIEANEQITDAEWDKMAYELKDLQEKYPLHCSIDFYDDLFKDWDGSTGIHLDLYSEEVIEMTKEYFRKGYV